MSQPEKIGAVVALPVAATVRAQRPSVALFSDPDSPRYGTAAWKALSAEWDAWHATAEGTAELARLQADRAARDAEQRIEAERAHGRALRIERLRAASDCRVTDAVYAALTGDSELRGTSSCEAVRSWARDAEAKPWLILSGSTGCGKSVAAAYGVTLFGGTWVRAEKLVRIFWANFGEQYEQQDEIRDAPFLVIDDLGSEADATRMAGALLEILDARKSRKHRTVVTTNLTQQAFSERYKSERLISRLFEQAKFHGDTAGDLRRAK